MLEGRAATWKGQPSDSVLDRVDLAAVEEGISWMRALEKDESALLEASCWAEKRRVTEEEERQRQLREARERAEQARRDKEQETALRLKEQEEANRGLRTRAYIAGGTALLALVIALIAGLLGAEARKQANIAQAEKQRADERARIATSLRFSIEARFALAYDRERGLHLASEALRLARVDNRQEAVSAAEKSLLQAVSSFGGVKTFADSSLQTFPSTRLAISPDGRWLLARGPNSPVPSNDPTDQRRTQLYDLSTQDPLKAPILLRSHLDPIGCFAFSPDGRWLATGSGDGENPFSSSQDHSTLVWDLASIRPDSAQPFPLHGHTGAVNALAFNGDGRLLVTAGDDQIARVWRITMAGPDSTPLLIKGHEQAVDAVTLSADGRRLATGGHDKTIRVWDLSGDTPVGVTLNSEGIVTNLVISPDGCWLASKDLSTVFNQEVVDVLLWDLSRTDLATAKPRRLKGHRAQILEMAMSLDSHWLATASVDNTVRLWDLKAGRDAVLPGYEQKNFNPTMIHTMIESTYYTNSLAFSRDSRWLLIGNEGNVSPGAGAGGVAARMQFRARLWDLSADDPSLEPVDLVGGHHPIQAVGFSADGGSAVTAGGGIITIWPLRSEELMDFARRRYSKPSTP
jgi:WD40 repeat protein